MEVTRSAGTDIKGIGPPRNPPPNETPSAPPAAETNNAAIAAIAMTRSLGLERSFPKRPVPNSLSFSVGYYRPLLIVLRSRNMPTNAVVTPSASPIIVRTGAVSNCRSSQYPPYAPRAIAVPTNQPIPPTRPSNTIVTGQPLFA